MTKYPIFYSWQSDISSKTNRYFIEDALKKAIKAIKRDESFSVDFVIDRDTSGAPGSPNIAETILGKIDQAQIVVSDVSIINAQVRDEARATPNPNVLFELGYAFKSLQEVSRPELLFKMNRIILVMNVAFGQPEMLPFDLRMQRVSTYNLPEDATSEIRAEEKKKLTKLLTLAIETIVAEQGVRNMGGYLEADQRLFQELKMLLSANNTIKYLRETSYGDSFPRDIHKGIMDFRDKFQYPNPEYAFFDSELETLRENLTESVEAFLDVIGAHTYPQDFNPSFNRISNINDERLIRAIDYKTTSSIDFENQMEEHRRKSEKIAQQLNEMAQDICNAYDDFVRRSREKLTI